MIKGILWDFNGTVLDDVAASVGAVNQMLERRHLAPITITWYQDHLVMPLERFYASVGISGEPIERLSEEFQRGCACFERPVFPEVLEALKRFQERGLRQFLFSSLHHEILIEQAGEREILSYFEKICGRQDRSLGSKRDAVQAYLNLAGLLPKEVLFVGDLVTDWQMAEELGAPCVLIPKGHQSRRVLEQTGAYIAGNAAELDSFLEE